MLKLEIKVACIQLNATENVAQNLARSSAMISEAKRKGAQLACLPEVFHYRGRSEWFPEASQTLTSPLVRDFQILAKRKKINILLGSIIEKSSIAKKFYNTSVFISQTGKILGFYRKIHLFDINLPGKVKVSESKYFLPGKRICSVILAGIKIGLTVCYDLRFPEIFRKLTKSGSQIILVPSNFTYHTGKDHWEALLRARAIENQVYIVAPDQVGENPVTHVKSFGESLVVDPWGRVLAKGSVGREEVLIATLDLKFLQTLRRQFPVLKASRF